MSKDGDRPRPPLAVVAQNDDRAIQLEYVKQALETDLAALAANVMRIARGAGKAYELGRQCATIVNRFEEYRAVAGHYPPTHEIDAAISVRRELPSTAKDQEYEWSLGIQEAVKGSLQIAASRLMGQNTQEAAGETQLFNGVQRLEKIREENRRAYADVPGNSKVLDKYKAPRGRTKKRRHPDASDDL